MKAQSFSSVPKLILSHSVPIIIDEVIMYST